MEKYLMISNIVLWVFVAVQMVFLFMVTRLVTQFLNRFRVNGTKIENMTLQVGTSAPLFREEDQHGNMIKLAENEGRYTAILFTRSDCPVCKEVTPHLANLHLINPQLRLLVVYDGSFTLSDLQAEKSVHYIQSASLMSAYYIETVPSIVLINPTHEIVAYEKISTYKKLAYMMEAYFQKAS